MGRGSKEGERQGWKEKERKEAAKERGGGSGVENSRPMVP